MSNSITELIKEAEENIRGLEMLHDRMLLPPKELNKYKLKLHNLDSQRAVYASNEDKFDFSSPESNAASMRWNDDYKLLKARILEYKGVVAFAEDDPTKAREYITLALAILPKDKFATSGLARTFPKEKDNRDGGREILKKIVIIAGIIALVWFMFYYQPSNNEDGPTDYCDTAICK